MHNYGNTSYGVLSWGYTIIEIRIRIVMPNSNYEIRIRTVLELDFRL
jgi:hypothetical protein